MLSPLSRLLEDVTVGAPRSAGGLTLYPLLGRSSGPEYRDLRSALEEGSLEITEQPGGGRVPELLVHSRASVGVLLLDGEELRGAKQDRVLNTSVLVPPGFEGVLPVTCVERGRWRATSRRFRSSGRSMPSSLRASMASRVSHSAREGRGFRGGQREVWEDIAKVHGTVGSRSRTDALGDALTASAGWVEQVRAALAPRPGELGSMVTWGREVLGIELVSHEQVWAAVGQVGLRGHAMEAQLRRRQGDLSPWVGLAPEEDPLCDAFAGPGLAPARAAEVFGAFRGSLAGARPSCEDSPGEGEDLRFTAGGFAGAALVADGAVVHARAWPC